MRGGFQEHRRLEQLRHCRAHPSAAEDSVAASLELCSSAGSPARLLFPISSASVPQRGTLLSCRSLMSHELLSSFMRECLIRGGNRSLLTTGFVSDVRCDIQKPHCRGKAGQERESFPRVVSEIA